MTTADLVINTHGLSKTYIGTDALKSLNLQVHPNSIFGFLGPNGAGKTTAIKLLLGLAKPTGGSAMVFGRDISRKDDEIRRWIGYLAQEGDQREPEPDRAGRGHVRHGRGYRQDVDAEVLGQAPPWHPQA